MLSLCGNCECVSSSQLQGELKTPFTHTFTLKLVERTIKVLDIFDITEGKLKVIIRGKVVSWIHDSSRVRGVVQAKSMTKFMDCYSKQVESWKTVHHFSILQRKTWGTLLSTKCSQHFARSNSLCISSGCFSANTIFFFNENSSIHASIHPA